MYTLYWIKRHSHTDIISEGYVGITKDFKERLRAHKKNKKKSPLTDAIKAIGWDNLVKQEVLTELDLESVLLLEKAFRPAERIGWNCQRGGELGVNPEWYDVEENRVAHSIATSNATKLGISKSDTIEKRAQRAVQSRIDNAESYKDISVGSKNSRAILTEDQVRDIKYNQKYVDMHPTEVGLLFNVKKHVINFIRSGKNWKHV